MKDPMPACVETSPDAKRKQQEILERYQHAKPGSPAEEELVQHFIPLVKTVVGRLAMTLPAHIDIDDLYSTGMVGLLNAVRNFDPHAGSTFESYARVRIRGAVIDELRRLDWVPRSVHDKARQVEAAMRKLEQAKGEIPTNNEMARELKLSVSDYEQLLEEIRPATFICLDSAQGLDSDGSSHYECIADESQEDPAEIVARREMARMIGARIDQLPDMQKKVLALYYFEDMRLREIAEIFGVTESRICQIHSQAVLAIKSHLTKQIA